MSDSTPHILGLKFIHAMEKEALRRGIAGRAETEAYLDEILKIAFTVIDAFRHDEIPVRLAKLKDSLELYKYAEDAAGRGNNLGELGPLMPDDTRDIVWEFMAGTLLDLRDAAGEHYLEDSRPEPANTPRKPALVE